MTQTKVSSDEFVQSYAQAFNTANYTVTGTEGSFNLGNLQTNDPSCFEINSNNLRVIKAGVYYVAWRWGTGTTVTGTANRMIWTMRATGGTTTSQTGFTSMAPASAWYSGSDQRIYTFNANTDLDFAVRTEGGGSILMEGAVLSVIKLA